MGLDQYLEVRRYIRRWTNESIDKYDGELVMTDDFAAMLTATSTSNIIEPTQWSGISVSIPVAQWRKANHIHKWFVDNIQQGNDNCGEYYVPREALEQLRDLCKQVVAAPALAPELLPTTSGFFFGGTEYDQWYIGDTEYTAHRLTELLEMVNAEDSFYYSSSW